jgi:hypothetical protein
MNIKKQFQEIRPSYVLLTHRETYKDFSTQELHDLFLQEIQSHVVRQGGDLKNLPNKLSMGREELIDCSIKYHEMLLEVIDKKLK